jgi:hypothetical protein
VFPQLEIQNGLQEGAELQLVFRSGLPLSYLPNLIPGQLFRQRRIRLCGTCRRYLSLGFSPFKYVIRIILQSASLR